MIVRTFFDGEPMSKPILSFSQARARGAHASITPAISLTVINVQTETGIQEYVLDSLLFDHPVPRSVWQTRFRSIGDTSDVVFLDLEPGIFNGITGTRATKGVEAFIAQTIGKMDAAAEARFWETNLRLEEYARTDAGKALSEAMHDPHFVTQFWTTAVPQGYDHVMANWEAAWTRIREIRRAQYYFLSRNPDLLSARHSPRWYSSISGAEDYVRTLGGIPVDAPYPPTGWLPPRPFPATEGYSQQPLFGD